MASEPFDLGTPADVPLGESVVVEVRGREIGVFHTPEGFTALANVCPHRGAPLCRGETTGTFVPSRPQEYHWRREGEILRCPWHAWEFDLLTGRALHVEGMRVATYRVSVEAGRLLLHT